MEIVNLAQIKIQRLGTANGNGFGNGFGSLFEVLVELEDASHESLRRHVIEQAQAQGEKGSLDQLKKLPSANRLDIIFDIKAGNTTFSTPYAVCHVFPALKANDRYFKLEEVK